MFHFSAFSPICFHTSVSLTPFSDQVRDVNMAPELAPNRPAPPPLLLPMGTASVTVSVAELLGGAFSDADGQPLGAAVLRAPASSLGRWQWSPAGADTWGLVELSAPLPPAADVCGGLPSAGPLAELTRQLTGAASCGGSSARMVQPVSLTPLYLSADHRVRFTAEDAGLAWSPREAEESAVLELVAWDGTKNPSPITLPDCGSVREEYGKMVAPPL